MRETNATSRCASFATWMIAATLAAGAGGLGCKLFERKDEAACQQGLATARSALEQENLEMVRQWRAYAYEQCEDATALATLDQEIQAKQNELAERAAKRAQGTKILQLFTTFAGDQARAPHGHCFANGPDAGWCTRSSAVTGTSSTFDVRFRQSEPDWVKIDTIVFGDQTCAELGATTVRSWTVQRTTGGLAKRSHCRLAAGSVAGFEALISVEPDGTRVTLFSHKHRSNDATLRRQLEQEGK